VGALQKALKPAGRKEAIQVKKEQSADRTYRFSATRLAAHRAKPGLSAADYGKLIGMIGATS